jgi:hypothetical protein
VRPPAALHHRVAGLEAADQEAVTPTIGAVIAAILEGRTPGTPVPDEVLACTKVGRLLLARRRRAEAGYPGRGG